MSKWEQCSLVDEGMYVFYIQPGGQQESARTKYEAGEYTLRDARNALESAKLWLGQNGQEQVNCVRRGKNVEYIYKRQITDQSESLM